MKTITAYHFTVTDKLRDGSTIPPIGEWLEHEGPIEPCVTGLHASTHPLDALEFAPGSQLHLVELTGEILHHGDPVDKIVATHRRRIATIDSTNVLLVFARWCALRVIHLWEAPAVVREFLETGREDIRDAAWDTARDAARAAAWDARAARDAAWDARDAAWAARDAAWAAAWAARDTARDARDAAWAARDTARDAARAARDTARDAQRKQFRKMITMAFDGVMT